MEKFSYGVEFYKSRIFSLKDKEEFKEKLAEAIKVEGYFFNLVPNVELIRPYILMSYRLNKDITFEDRILYIRGLIYASDYIDLNDLYNLPEEFTYFEMSTNMELYTKKNTVWNYTAYLACMNTKEEIDRLLTASNDSEYQNTINDEHVVSDENTYEIDSEMFEKLAEFVKRNKGIDIEDKDIQISIESEEENDNDKEDFISIEDKLNIFLEKLKDYLECTIDEKLKNGYIKEEDIQMVLNGMSDWFVLIFKSINDLIEINQFQLNYNNENLYNYL